jgi:uncharacterized 2Fe-2S/4Fe-4S cluster protein (DUF4445 family)
MGRRLGCQATVQGDIVIDVPATSQVHKQVVRKEASTRPIILDPATRLYLVSVDEPDMHEPTGDLERLKRALANQWNISDVEVDLKVLHQLQKSLRKGEWTVTGRTAPPRSRPPACD